MEKEKLKHKINYNDFQKKCQAWFFVGISIIIFGFILIAIMQKIEFFLLLLIGFIILVFVSVTFNRKVHKYKIIIMNYLVNKHFENPTFNPDKGLTEKAVYQSELFIQADRFSSNDYLAGSVNGVYFESSDIHLEEEDSDSDGKGSSYSTTFLGRFFIIDFNKYIDARVFVVEGHKLTLFSRLKRIRLESIEFNKTFNTYTDNDHLAFYALTPHMMERLLLLERNHSGKLYISFIHDKLYIGIYNNKDAFTISLFGPTADEIIDYFEKDLIMIKDIILSLGLDNNIFKKERENGDI